MKSETATWLGYAEENLAVALLALEQGYFNACLQPQFPDIVTITPIPVPQLPCTQVVLFPPRVCFCRKHSYIHAIV